MPSLQSAQVANYEFGAPVALADVAIFKVGRPGGIFDITVLGEGDGPVTVSVEVSTDGTSYAATTSGNNKTAVTAAVTVARGKNTYSVLLRAETDKFFKIKASGGVRFVVQMRGHEAMGVTEVSF